MLGDVLLITGGKVNYSFAEQYISTRHYDTIICADSGLKSAHFLHLPVDYAMGDFDSVPQDILQEYREGRVRESMNIKFTEYPRAKDYTDTQMVLEWILHQGVSSIEILGATGGRLDHLLSNINVLMKPLKQGVLASIVDENNRLYLVNKDTCIKRSELFGKYISLQPLSERVYPVRLEGFVYDLPEGELHYGTGRAISNEMLPEADEAWIRLGQGELIVIESRD